MKKILLTILFFIGIQTIQAQYYLDADGDGYGNPAVRQTQPVPGFVSNANDPNDSNRCVPNSNGCGNYYLDSDGDGFGGPAQMYGYLYPYLILINNDCNDGNALINPNTIWYLDGDKDGIGINNTSTNKKQCLDPSTVSVKYVLTGGDCNDSNTLITTYTWYLDNDKDGFGTNNTATNKTQCLDPSTTSVKYILTFGDLDDTKTCVTNIPPTTYYQDLDGDTYGNAKVAQSCSTQPAGYVTNADDADDANPNVTIVKINMTYDNAGNQLNRQFVVPTSVQSKLATTDRIDCLPNPVVDNATVSWQLIGVKTMKSIRLYNDKGVLLQTFLGLEKANTQAISFKNYAAGQYQLLLQYSDSTQKAITITKQ